MMPILLLSAEDVRIFLKDARLKCIEYILILSCDARLML
jgi:hypothetical protein